MHVASTGSEIGDIVSSVDGPYAVITLVSIGIFLLVWKYGGELLSLARDSNQKANQAHDAVVEVKDSIQTNHGSKNLGDAVDRLTDLATTLLKETRANETRSKETRRELTLHIADSEGAKSRLQDTMSEIDERLNLIEQDQQKG